MTHVPICCPVCKRRGNEQIKIVRVPFERAGGELHAVDYRYHITSYQKGTSNPQPEDEKLLIH